ncbi:MAG TPA: hypothetical protein VH300_06260 [Thermoleophilaceae bacterium]|jgi:peptidoglycan/LPS O-acetylase OafA/YrhL|nr:hypothetical protein [Thermoleophilaceae bacterium]
MDERHEIEPTPATSENGGLPVLAGTEARAIEKTQPVAVPAPVVAAAGGAVAGALAYVILRVLRRPVRRRGSVRIGRRWGRRGTLEVAGSRSFLVDVHVLKR